MLMEEDPARRSAAIPVSVCTETLESDGMAYLQKHVLEVLESNEGPEPR